MEQQQQQPPQQPQQQQQQQPPQQQPQVGGVPGPAGRRLHIAHRRSPSELTPLMSMFANPG
ncbi:cell wall biogenesis phosphatase Ssd1, partial [Fusarium albosuccineum]